MPLEQLGNLCLLLGLFAYLSSRRTGHRRVALWAGAAFGIAARVRFWWAVPVLVLIGWHVGRDRGRDPVSVTAGAAISLVVINLPFAIVSDWAMWQMVVGDQLGRPESGASLANRAGWLLGVGHLLPGAPPGIVAAIVLVGAAKAVTAIPAAWRCRLARPVMVLLVAQAAVLAATPSWFVYCPDYLEPAVAVTAAAAFGAGAASRRQDAGASGSGASRCRRGALMGAPGAGAGPRRGAGHHCPFLITETGAAPRHPSAELTAAASTVRCLMSDSSIA